MDVILRARSDMFIFQFVSADKHVWSIWNQPTLSHSFASQVTWIRIKIFMKVDLIFLDYHKCL